MDFNDKVVLVTGASRGIGRAIAQAFAERGANIVAHYNHNGDLAQATLDSLAGGPHYFQQGDIRDPNAVEAIVQGTLKQAGRIDILINNAGIYQDHPLAEVSYETWQKSWRLILETNLIGAANMSYCVAQEMIKQGHGRIVNISSRGSFRGEPTAPAYGASKAGMNAMSQSLAKYLAPYNIFVGVVAPGFVQTDMAREHLQGAQGEAIRNQSPLGRVARPEEVAYAALFLASEGSQFMTGAIIDVNGASYLRT